MIAAKKFALLRQCNCWHLGNLIIALEAPDDAKIYTTDGHFDLICSVLGKRLFVDSQMEKIYLQRYRYVDL